MSQRDFDKLVKELQAKNEENAALLYPPEPVNDFAQRLIKSLTNHPDWWEVQRGNYNIKFTNGETILTNKVLQNSLVIGGSLFLDNAHIYTLSGVYLCGVLSNNDTKHLLKEVRLIENRQDELARQKALEAFKYL